MPPVPPEPPPHRNGGRFEAEQCEAKRHSQVIAGCLVALSVLIILATLAAAWLLSSVS